MAAARMFNDRLDSCVQRPATAARSSPKCLRSFLSGLCCVLHSLCFMTSHIEKDLKSLCLQAQSAFLLQLEATVEERNLPLQSLFHSLSLPSLWQFANFLDAKRPPGQREHSTEGQELQTLPSFSLWGRQLSCTLCASDTEHV